MRHSWGSRHHGFPPVRRSLSPTAGVIPVPRFESIDWYQHPDLYDAVFAEETACEVDFIEAVYSHLAHTSGRRVLEPACGTGRLLTELALRGWDVTGFDLSETMLGYAARRLRHHGLDGSLHVDCMTSFQADGHYDLACNMLSTMRLLLTESCARNHLRCIADALRPGGIYIMTMPLTDYHDRVERWERWVTPRPDGDITSVIRGWPACRRTRIERLRCRMTVASEATGTRRFETSWRFRTYGPRQALRLIASEPRFELASVCGGDFDIDRTVPLDGSRCDTTFILRRR